MHISASILPSFFLIHVVYCLQRRSMAAATCVSSNAIQLEGARDDHLV